MNSKSTWEQVIKFDSGLTIGRHLCAIQDENGNTRKVLVDISSRGVVHILPEPTGRDMYLSWSRVKGDNMEHSKRFTKVYLWAGRPGTPDHATLSPLFSPPPVCVIRKQTNEQ